MSYSEDDDSAKYLIMSIGVGIIIILFAAWFIVGHDLMMAKVFGPKYEQVRRETFEQSKAYNDGMITELQNMQFEYIKATDVQKASLRSIILHRASAYPCEKMPADLCQFITQLKSEK